MKLNLFILILLTLVLSSCGGYSQNLGEIPTGYEGMELTFSEFPDTKVYPRDRFSFNLDVYNEGYYDSKNSVMTLLELENTKREYPEKKIPDTGLPILIDKVEGKKVRPEGGYKGPFFFNYFVESVPGGGTEVVSNIVANLCYTYKTEANLVACMGKSREPCEFNALNDNAAVINYGQGAPISINDVQETLVPVEDGNSHVPVFVITIGNSGNGDVFRNVGDTLNKACSSEPPVSNVTNTLDYRLTLSSGLVFDSSEEGDQDFDCNPIFPKFSQNEAKIICKLKGEHAVDVGNTYTTPFKIELGYVYRTFTNEHIIFVQPVS